MNESWGGSSGYNPDFVERNGAWILSVLGIFGAAVSAMLVYMLKSRCSYIKCCGVECERDVLNLETRPNVELNSRRIVGRYLPNQSSNTELAQP